MTELSFIITATSGPEAGPRLATAIRQAMEFIDRSGVEAEILLIDQALTEGEDDSSSASARLAADFGLRLLRCGSSDLNATGKGAALAAGISSAKGRYILTGPGDQSCNFSRPDAFLLRLRLGADLVLGNRFSHLSTPALCGPQPGIRLRARLNQWLYGVAISDVLNPMRGFLREAFAESLPAEADDPEIRMLLRAAAEGMRVDEVPMRPRPKDDGAALDWQWLKHLCDQGRRARQSRPDWI